MTSVLEVLRQAGVALNRLSLRPAVRSLLVVNILFPVLAAIVHELWSLAQPQPEIYPYRNAFSLFVVATLLILNVWHIRAFVRLRALSAAILALNIYGVLCLSYGFIVAIPHLSRGVRTIQLFIWQFSQSP